MSRTVRNYPSNLKDRVNPIWGSDFVSLIESRRRKLGRDGQYKSEKYGSAKVDKAGTVKLNTFDDTGRKNGAFKRAIRRIERRVIKAALEC